MGSCSVFTLYSLCIAMLCRYGELNFQIICSGSSKRLFIFHCVHYTCTDILLLWWNRDLQPFRVENQNSQVRLVCTYVSMHFCVILFWKCYLVVCIWHHVGMFYFTLGNLSPKFRSKLSAIQLVGIVKTTVLAMYGMDAVLQPIVDDLMKLVGNLHNYSSSLLKALTFV